MAYPIGLDAIAQVSIQGHCDGQQFISLFHYRVFSGAIVDGAAEAQNIATAFMAPGAAGATYLDCIGSDIVDMEVYVQWIWPSRYLRVKDAAGFYAGQAANATRSANIAAAITKRGERANRHNIATLHMPALPDDFIADGMVSPGALAIYANLALNLDDTLVTGGGVTLYPQIYRRDLPEESQRIFSAVTQTTLRVNRRRTVGLGT